MSVTTSQVLVVRACATLRDGDRGGALAPDQHELVGDVVTGGPGTSVTSAMTASMATLPTSGTRCPRTSAAARFERRRDQPSP